jgi:uncharacterized protein (DUF885 family)
VTPTSPHPVFALSDRVVDDYAALQPLAATAHGIAGHDHELDDASPDGVAAVADLLRTTRDELRGLPAATDADTELAVAVLDAFATEQLDRYERGAHLRDVSHMESGIGHVRDTIDVQDRSTPEGWWAVARRLAGMGAYVDGWQASVALGLERSDVVAARQVRAVVDQLRASVAPTGTYTQIVTGYDGSDDALRRALADGLETTRAVNLEAAAWLEHTYLPAAPEADGVGRERYLAEARFHLGSDLDPDATYRWGWEQIRRIRDRMRAVAKDVDPSLDLAGVVRHLKTDPSVAAPTQDAFAAEMRARQDHAISVLDGTHVDLPAAVREVDVRLAAPGAPLGARYMAPSEDFSRPGSIWWALGDKAPVPLWEEVTTAYHEGFPGHHMQIGLAVTARDRLSRVHRSLYWKAGAGEGWALYAERLMDELGFLDAPMYVLGYLAAAMLRACRVVVDLGCHLDLDIPEDAPFHPGERWRYELGVEMLTDYAFLDRAYAESEVTRYLGWPGQAITYSLGEQAILELRDEARAAHGAAFDLERFHAVVLSAGAVGLDLLRRVVRGARDA